MLSWRHPFVAVVLEEYCVLPGMATPIGGGAYLSCPGMVRGYKKIRLEKCPTGSFHAFVLVGMKGFEPSTP